MTPKQAIEYFGTQSELARALGIKQPPISVWLRNGQLPILRQFQLELITGGALRAERDADHRVAAAAAETPQT